MWLALGCGKSSTSQFRVDWPDSIIEIGGLKASCTGLVRSGLIALFQLPARVCVCSVLSSAIYHYD